MNSSLRMPYVPVLMAGIAAVGIQSLMLSPLLPDVAAGLSATVGRIGAAAGAYGVGVATAALVAAPRMARWNKPLAIKMAFVVLALGLLLCALAPTWHLLALGQLVAGLACGIIIPTTYALTSDITAPEMRAQALGRVLFGWSVAMVAGVPMAAGLAALVEWRGTFGVVSGISALMALVLWLKPMPSASAAVGATGMTRYSDILQVNGVLSGYVATFAYMIAFYQTYTFIGDHVRGLHQNGLVIAAAIPLAYGVGFGSAMVFDKRIDALGPRRLLPYALLLVAANYALLPLATRHPLTAVIYPLVWGVANHLCMTTLVSYLSALSVNLRSGIMSLFSFVTYFSVGVAGAVYGAVYEVHGFAAVSLAATATLVLAAAVFRLSVGDPES